MSYLALGRMNPSDSITPQQRKLKIEKYCAYQERSHQQVRDKLYQLGAHEQEVEETIVELIQSDFLNEQRFVEAYVRGKFRMKGWGRNKIRNGLMPHRVDKKMMIKAVDSLNEDEYLVKLKEIIKKKASRLNEKNQYRRKAAIHRHAAQKGYESHLIYEIINELDGKK